MGRVVVSAVIESIEDLYRVLRGEVGAPPIRRIEVTDALVDTGATALSLPRRFIAQLGLLPIRTIPCSTSQALRYFSAHCCEW